MAKIEILNDGGAVVGLLFAPEGEDIGKHFPHYPGAVAYREVDPKIVEAEGTAAQEKRDRVASIQAVLPDTLLDIENRLRVLEKKPTTTAEEYKGAALGA